MFIGLCLLAVNLQNVFEIFLTHILLFFEKKSMKLMVLNNLKAHKLRNRNAAIIYSLALGFIIFILVSAKLIILQSKLVTLSYQGSYPNLIADNVGPYLMPSRLDPLIKQNLDIIDSFTYITYDILKLKATEISNMIASDNSRINSISANYYGILPSFFNVTGYELLDINY